MYKPGDEVVPKSDAGFCGFNPKRDKIIYIGKMSNGKAAIEFNGVLYSVDSDEIMPKPKLKKAWFNVYMCDCDRYGRKLDGFDREFFLGDPCVSEKDANALRLEFYKGGHYIKTISMMVPE
jgi:hypothetical protein